MTRADILAASRDWLGTPYRHQASRKGVGVDCLGLVRGVWRECVGQEPEALPSYTPVWAEATGQDELIEAARRHLIELPIGKAQPGDVLVFRMSTGVPAKHCAIVSVRAEAQAGQIIHAYWGRHVTETRLVPWWQRRIAGAFSFPGIED